MPLVRLVSCDGITFPADIKVARMSTKLAKTLDDKKCEEEGKEETIPIEKVCGEVLEGVIEWYEHYKDDPEIHQNEFPVLSEWDKEFWKKNKEIQIDLIQAALDLNFPGLMHAGCEHVVKMIYRKSPEEIRKILKRKYDVTPKDEEGTESN